MDLYSHLKKISLVLVVLGLWAVTAHAQPWVPQVIWQRQGQGDWSRYGYAILPLGDQNTDGYSDFGVYQPGGGSSPPLVELFHGGNPPPQTPYMVIAGDSLWHIDPAPYVLGDINGDGYVDWYLTADSISNPDSYGCGFIFFGGPSQTTTPNMVWPFTGYWQGLQKIGDVNGDGYDDLLFNDGWNGRCAIYLGGNPPDTIPHWQRSVDMTCLGVGDLNGDIYSDLVFYVNTDRGATAIYFGSSAPDTLPARYWHLSDWLMVECVRDLNGDHYDDLVSAAGDGTIQVRYGSSSLDSITDAVLNFVRSNVPDFMYSAGDLDHDGYNDLLSLDTNPGPNGSWVTVHLGGQQLQPQPALALDWRDPPYNWVPFGVVSGLGDVNGDGFDDFMATAVEGVGLHRGVAVIYGGRSAGANNPHSLIPQQMRLSVYPNPFNASTTISFTVPRAGEVSIQVFDVTGRLVKTLCDGRREAGEQAVGFEGKGLSSGVYVVRVQAAGAVRMEKMVLLR